MDPPSYSYLDASPGRTASAGRFRGIRPHLPFRPELLQMADRDLVTSERGRRWRFAHCISDLGARGPNVTPLGTIDILRFRGLGPRSLFGIATVYLSPTASELPTPVVHRDGPQPPHPQRHLEHPGAHYDLR